MENIKYSPISPQQKVIFMAAIEIYFPLFYSGSISSIFWEKLHFLNYGFLLHLETIYLFDTVFTLGLMHHQSNLIFLVLFFSQFGTKSFMVCTYKNSISLSLEFWQRVIEMGTGSLTIEIWWLLCNAKGKLV